MASEQMGKLFQEFSQAFFARRTNTEAPALGSSISRRFCQMVGSDIIESEPGRGSTFTIRLPRMVEAAEVTG